MSCVAHGHGFARAWFGLGRGLIVARRGVGRVGVVFGLVVGWGGVVGVASCCAGALFGFVGVGFRSLGVLVGSSGALSCSSDALSSSSDAPSSS